MIRINISTEFLILPSYEVRITFLICTLYNKKVPTIINVHHISYQ